MKYILSFIFAFTSFYYVVAQSEFKFEETIHDFGTIKEDGGKVTHLFKFKNIGDQPIVINNVIASCGCTTPKYKNDPILPGQEGEISVTYNPFGRPGSFRKSIRVRSNIKERVLYIKGKVEARVRTPKDIYKRQAGLLNFPSLHVGFGRVLNSKIKTIEVKYINFQKRAVELKLGDLPDIIRAEIKQPKVEPDSVGTVVFTIDPKMQADKFGFESREIQLICNGEREKGALLHLSYNVVEDFSLMSAEERAAAPEIVFEKRIEKFESVKAGKKIMINFPFTNRGSSDLKIRDIRTSSGSVIAASDSDVVKSGESCNIKVEFNTAHRVGTQNRSISIVTNDPKSSLVVLRITGTVLK